MTKQTRVFAFVLAWIACFFSASAHAATEYQAYFSTVAQSGWHRDIPSAAADLAGKLNGIFTGTVPCAIGGVTQNRQQNINYRWDGFFIVHDRNYCLGAGQGWGVTVGIRFDSWSTRTRTVKDCEGGREPDAKGDCVCKAGTKEPPGGVGACIPDSVCSEMTGKFVGSGVQLDYGQRSVDRLGRMVGSSTSGCHASSGCVIQGTIAGCWGSSTQGGSGCLINTPTYTGGKCSDTGNDPSQCPSGSKPSEYAAGVCIPDENKCPSGSSPSKYAAGVCIPDENPCPAGQAPSKYAAGVCVPEDDPNADGKGEEGKPTNCPPGRVASRYAVGVCIPADTTVGNGGGGGGGTVCKDGKCTTTNPDGSTDEESEGDFCKKNPETPMCKKGNFGGSCGSWTCEGDAIQCAMAKEQHKTNCKLFDEKNGHKLTQAALDGTDEQSADKLKAKAEQITVDKTFNQTGFGWGTSCPLDPEIPLGFVDRSFTIPFSRICGPLEALSLAGVGITLLGCLVWVIGGKKA
ncbi:hypothetical protein [Acidovorax temperans]|uniref:hypothetical protein n=1 Tax=Acidovorax temperans TaxID=80878 RepID=UPI0030D439FE